MDGSAAQLGTCDECELKGFCDSKVKDLEKLDIWQCVPRDATRQLVESFIAFVMEVWLVHLLSLAFEQPAALSSR